MIASKAPCVDPSINPSMPKRTGVNGAAKPDLRVQLVAMPGDAETTWELEMLPKSDDDGVE